MAKPIFSIVSKPDIRKVAAAYKPIRRAVVDDKMRVLSDIIHKNIVNEAPKRTGILRAAIKKRRKGDGQYEVFVDGRTKGAKYERYVREGAKPHSIYPVRKKALWWKELAHPIAYVKKHPGQRANDYWQRGINNSQNDIQSAATELGKAVAQELIVK